MESLSAYARQFLTRMERPEVDNDGLSPAISIEQKTTSHNQDQLLEQLQKFMITLGCYLLELKSTLSST